MSRKPEMSCRERLVEQVKHNTLVSAVRAIVTENIRGDHNAELEFLATVLVKHAFRKHRAVDVVRLVSMTKLV